MKKLVLFTTTFGLVSLPVASLIACGSFGDSENEKNLDEKEKKDLIKPKDSYKTTRSDSDTLDFKIGERCDATKLGVDTIFSKEFEFEVKDYDDLAGTLTVSVEHTGKDQVINLLRDDVKIHGFKSYSAEEFLSRITQNLPSDRMIASELDKKLKPSELRNSEILNVDTLGIAHHFNFRKAEHFIIALDHNDLVGELIIDLKIAIADKDKIVRLTVTDLEMESTILNERLKEIREIIEKLAENFTTTHSDKLPSTVVQRISETDFWDQLGIGSFPDFDNQNIKLTFKIGKNTSDAKGQIELVLTFKAENEGVSIERSKTILISGFLSLDDFKQDEDRLKAQTIKNYLEKDFDKQTSLKTSLPSDVKKKFVSLSDQHLSLLGLSNLPQKISDGAQINFTLEEANDSVGTLILVATIKVGSVPEVKTRLLIRGFATLEQVKQKERQTVEQELRNLLNYIERSKRKTSLRNQLPSEISYVGESVSFEKIGLQDLPEQVKSGILVKLEVIDVNDESGTLEIRVDVSKRQQDMSRNIVVSGYKRKIEVEKERKEKVLAQLKDLLNWINAHRNLTSIKDKRPSKIGSVGQNVTLSKLGLDEISEHEKDGALIEFKITDIDDFEGKMVLNVTVSKLGEKLESIHTVAGYKTHQSEIKDLFVWIKTNYSQTVLENDLPTEVVKGRKRIEFEDLGFAKLPSELFGEYELLVEVKDANNGKGTVELRVVIRKVSLIDDFNHTVTGFKTTDHVINYLWAKWRWFANNRTTTIHKDKLPSLIGNLGQNLTLDMLGLAKLDGTDFCDDGCPTVKLILSDTNDASGELKVLVKLSHRGVPLEQEVWIKGFKTIGNELEEVIDLIKSEIWTTSFRDKFPSTIGEEDQATTFQELGLNGLPARQKNDIEILLTILGINDRQGTIKVKAVLQKKGITGQTDFTVVGFKTTADQVKELEQQAAQLADWIEKNWAKTSQSNKLPSHVGLANQKVNFAELGLVRIPDHIRGDFEITITIGKVKDKLGEIDIEITLVNSGVKLERELTVKGFKTTDSITDELNALFAWIKKHRNRTSLGNTIPSDLGGRGREVTFKYLGLSEIPSNLVNGIDLRLMIEKPNDVTGVMTVTFVLSKSGVKLSEKLTIEGFKKVSHQLDELFNLIKKRLQAVKMSNKLPSEMGKKGTKLSFLDFGLPPLDSSEQQGVRVEILVENVENKTGQLKITLKLSKLGQEKVDTLVIGGFLKESESDGQALDKLVERIKELNGATPSAKEVVVKIDPNSDLYSRDVSKIRIDEIEKDPDAWNIVLPKIPSDIGTKWSLDKVVTEESTKRLIVTLEISKGSTKQKVVFRIEGFEPLIDKMIAQHLDKLPFQMMSSFGEKLVGDFKVNQQYKFSELGVNHPDVIDKIFKFKLIAIDLNDKNGTIELRATVWADSTDFNKSKTIVVAGFWNDAKREISSAKIARFHEMFNNFNYDKPIKDLDEEEVYRMPVYDKTSQGKLFIGDERRYSPGQEFSIEELKILQRGQLINDQLNQLGSSYRFHFEIVERPESGRFHGNIRVRAVVRHVDLRVTSSAVFVIGGFQSFGNYVQDKIAEWEKQIPRKISTNSQGMLYSLFEDAGFDKWQDYLFASKSVAKRFIEVTGLGQTFKGLSFGGKYTLDIIGVFGDARNKNISRSDLEYVDKYPTSMEFEFKVGLKGDQWDSFNEKIINSKKFAELYRGKRSFSRIITGFDSRESVLGAFESWIKQNNQTFDVVSADIDTSHFMGIFRQIYGNSALPEFAFDFATSSMYKDKRRKLESWLAANAKTSHSDIEKTIEVDYRDPISVKKWLRVLRKENTYFNWKKIPIDWETTFGASLRPLVDQAEPYFKFVQVTPDKGGKTNLLFEIALRFRSISPKKGERPSKWNDLQQSALWEINGSGLRNVLKSRFHLRVPSSISQYMENILKVDALKSKFFTKKAEEDLGVKLLSSKDDHHRIEVKMPVFKTTDRDPANEPSWEVKLRAKQWLFDYQANHSVGTFIWEHFREGYGNPGRLDKGHSLENILVARRHINLPIEFKLHEMDFQKYLGELGINIMFEKISSTDFNHELDYNSPHWNAVIKFRPWLVYNAHIWIAGRNKPITYVNAAQKPIFVKSKTVWEVHYKLYKNY